MEGREDPFMEEGISESGFTERIELTSIPGRRNRMGLKEYNLWLYFLHNQSLL